MLKDKKIMLGVTGGIAVYKACDLTSQLTQQGADVRVVMTKSATEFVSPLTFQALSRNPVYTDVFDEKDPNKIAHIDVADWVDIAIIAPATANVISKMAHGIADDMLSATLLATRAEIYIAPAMNVHMYANKAVVENMEKLVSWGYHFIEPGDGYLACGYVGKGRLEEPKEIISVINNHLRKTLLLEGKNILISAGPTREAIDPVRFFTNHSSGKMGFALAEAAATMGAHVTLVSGPSELKVSQALVHRINVTSAAEMDEVMHQYFHQSDVVIKAAAVADYRPTEVYQEKLKKSSGTWSIELERTNDILQSLGDQKQEQFLVGFAAETSNPIENGQEKLVRKNLDAIVVNNVAEDGAGFGVDTNIVTYISRISNEQRALPLASKDKVAEQLIELISHDLKLKEDVT